MRFVWADGKVVTSFWGDTPTFNQIYAKDCDAGLVDLACGNIRGQYGDMDMVLGLQRL